MNAAPRQQRGIVAVLLAVGMLAVLVMVGLAFDTGHLVLNKSRLQSSVDAAALAAAKVLDQTDSEAQATAAANAVFALNAEDIRNERHVPAGAEITVQYSNTLSPFAPGTTPPNYVRVRAEGMSMWTSFTALLGFNELTTAASAVAGPSARIVSPSEVCDLVPMMVCGDMDVGAAGDFGFSKDNVTLLKLASGAPSPVGPGNFQLIELGGSGADVVRHNLAGGYDGCLRLGETVTSKTGNNAGPTAQGLNTRFGRYQGGGMNAADYPPDKVTTEPEPRLAVASDGITVVLREPGHDTTVTDIHQLSFSYESYMERLAKGPYDRESGTPQRRVIALPIVDCRTMINGHGTLPVAGVGCFFMLQQVEQSGNLNYVFGQFQRQCAVGGKPGPEPGGPGIYRIVLHNDPDSDDS
jgi:Flp pilus assembly protein TadG